MHGLFFCWPHKCTTSALAFWLIGKYQVMSNSNIYSEVHIHWIESLQFFCWHAFPAICSLQTRRTGVCDQMEQLFTNREFHFCSHRNFRVFFLNGKRPVISANLRNETSDGNLLDNKKKEFAMTCSTWKLSSSTNKKLLQWTQKTRIQYFKSPASRLKVQNQRRRVGNFLVPECAGNH